MKYKLLGIGMLLLIIFFSFAATAMEEEEGVWRVHQHQSARGPQAGCDCDGGELCTHLPLVVIETGGKDIPGVPLTDEGEKPELFSVTDEGEDLLPVKVSIMDNEDQNHHPSDRADKVSQALIRVRGNSSRYFDKLGYLVRFTDEKGEYQEICKGCDKYPEAVDIAECIGYRTLDKRKDSASAYHCHEKSGCYGSVFPETLDCKIEDRAPHHGCAESAKDKEYDSERDIDKSE